MIERNQVISFDFLAMRRDFRNTAKGEVFYVELTTTEDDWGNLRSFPRDAIGAVVLKWLEACQSISLGITAFVRRHKNREESGEIFLIQLPISQDDWIRLRDHLTNGSGVAAATWVRRASEESLPKPATKAQKPKREKKPKAIKEPTRYGQFWYQVDKAGFHNRPDVRAWTGYSGLDEDEAREALRRALKVEHRSVEASPDYVIEAMATAEGLDGAITLIENLKRRGLRVVPKEESEAA